MRASPELGNDLSPTWMAKMLGVLYMSGGSLGIAWTILPHGRGEGDRVVITMAVLAILVGVTLELWPRDRFPLWALHTVLSVVQVVIGVGYSAVPDPANDLRLFFVWATVCAFFFPPRIAAAHGIWTGVCLGAALTAADAPFEVTGLIWLMTMSAVAAVGALVGIASSRMRTVQRILHAAAVHDPLTGLLNRRGFTSALDAALAERVRLGGSVLVLLIDLDHFKIVNDTYGHQVGDALLVEVAPRLRAAVRDEDVVARMGGDEFAIICADPSDRLDLDALVDRLQGAWSEPVVLSCGSLPLSGSVGVVRSHDAEDSPALLLRDADVALYRAKAVQRGSVVVYDEPLRAYADRAAAVDVELRGALDRGELSLAFQPVVDLQTGPVVGAEALLRWDSPTLGRVHPEEFVPIAEDRGLINDMGRWVIEECCRVLSGWRSSGVADPAFALAVNVSGRQLSPGFAGTVADTLVRHDLPPYALQIEITESVLLDDSPTTARAIADLGALGVPLVLDDFGTGFSSLSYLHRFPLTGLKVDRSFVIAVTTSPRQRALVGAMLRMAEALGLDVVAEGIETPEVAEILRSMGCSRAQGYLWARPMADEDFARLLAGDRPSVWLTSRTGAVGSGSP